MLDIVITVPKTVPLALALEMDLISYLGNAQDVFLLSLPLAPSTMSTILFLVILGVGRKTGPATSGINQLPHV